MNRQMPEGEGSGAEQQMDATNLSQKSGRLQALRGIIDELAAQVVADHGYRSTIAWTVEVLAKVPTIAVVVTAAHPDPVHVARMCDEFDAALRDPEPARAIVTLFDLTNRLTGGAAEDAAAIVRALSGRELMSEDIRRCIGRGATLGHVLFTSAPAGA